MSDVDSAGMHPFARGLERNAANHVPLSPVSFLERSALVYPAKIAVRHGRVAYTYADLRGSLSPPCLGARPARCRPRRHGGDHGAQRPRDARGALRGTGARGDPQSRSTSASTPRTIAACLAHGEAKVLLTDGEFAPVVREALALLGRPLLVVDLDDTERPGHGDPATRLGAITYDALLGEGDPHFAWDGPIDEWDALALLYTSGTTGDPKGVVYHHRGAYLNALGNALAFGLSPSSVYLWTLPMFHCNGWTYTWAVTAVGGTHVCLRRVEPAPIFRAIAEQRVTHLCGAPIVLNLLVHAPPEAKSAFGHRVDVATGGAAPPSAIIEAMEAMGFRVTHLYGLTESYGPATLCAPQDDWPELPASERARRMARQGVPMPTLANVQVGEPATGAPVPRDGTTLGEVMLRGNTVMKGYLKNPQASASAFAGGWYRTGDLAVWHPDNYIEIKDRSKDIIISGGENVSSLEIEECLYRHPSVMEAAVVARPDAHWGETPCAFVTLKPGAPEVSGGRADRLVPAGHRALQGAEARRVRAAAQDRHRQDPEDTAARTSEGGHRMTDASLFRPDLLAGRTALVTGASAGLGRHFAGLLARHGATVVVAARRLPELTALVAEIDAAGGAAHAVALDVRNTDAVERAVATAGPLDIVVNNAGIATTKPALDTDEAAWQQVLDTNLSGAFRVARAAARAMVEAGRGGAIVNIASILAFRVAKQVPAYVAAKAGLVKLTEALALELASRGVRVNALAPGYVETDLNRDFLRSPAGQAMQARIPSRRFGTASDLDGALLLLASEAGAYITGATVVVDGGHGLAWL